ncbi:coiled-coil domain-containing protein 18 isoform X2 [Ornithorhynchus anatinus]|uniref:Coiled-coil domain containing 18 n=1 Tax=Ornithorhynchus anatinus TaxID=9258 RepID=A0A6I8PM50_ORNAN|nr:coiled-coil domain-containing protein 18 isoform X2 [Ornithorhynchus anatinus]
MEFCSLKCREKDDEEEILLANVASLRSRLKKTELSLQNVGQELIRTSASEHSDGDFNHNRFERLTLEDLVQPNYSGLVNFKSVANMSHGRSDCQRKLRNQSYRGFALDTSLDQESQRFREKLSDLQEQNATLLAQNRTLMNEVESVHFELAQSKARICFLESARSQSSGGPIFEEKIINLEAEITAQDKVLRDAEDKLEQSQKMVVEKELSLLKVKNEFKMLKMDLLEQSNKAKRVEQQRNEALNNAEGLSKAFRQYKERVAEKLEKVQAEEAALEKGLINCEKEKEELQEKCDAYRNELETLKQKLRQSKEENISGKEKLRNLGMKNSEVVSQLMESKQKIFILECELKDKGELFRQKCDLKNENTELKALIASQNERLNMCQKEIENSRLELNSLEMIVSQLPLNREVLTSKSCVCKRLLDNSSAKEHACDASCESNKSVITDLRIKLAMKEAEVQKLRASLTISQVSQNFSVDDYQENEGLMGLETEPVKLNGNQVEKRYIQKLHIMSKQFERERQRIVAGLEELRTKLTKAETENSDLKANMARRTSQFQVIQEELLEKAANTSRLESEVTKKCSQLLTLEKQLEEKTVAYSSSAAKNIELEHELVEKNEKIYSLELDFNAEHEKMCLAFEKARMVHLEQHKEMEKQIELLQVQLEKKDQQFNEQEKTVTILQQDILCKQHHLESLDRLLIESRGEMEKQNIKKDEALKLLQNQVSEETIKVRQLSSALDMCKDELAMHLSELEGNKEKFEQQLKKKSEEVNDLQKELTLRNHSLQEISQQNVSLQHTLQQQEQMLQEETIRNGELEDSQANLEKQVSKLEQQLQKQKEHSAEELSQLEEKLQIATRETDLKRQKITELTSTVRQIKLEMDQCKVELIEMEKELVHLRRDGENKASQLNHLDMVLKQTQGELKKKAQTLNELEMLQEHTQADLKSALEKQEKLEAELQNAHVELKNTLKQLQALRDMLQNAQLSLEEKCTTIKDLRAELSECKIEIEDKKQELLEMDQALKERNWELKQRAAQITQLDVAIREHKGEMEQKIIRLEGTLEKSELEVNECNKQISNLDEKLQSTKEQLHEKEFDVLQKDQEINQLKKETERKQHRIVEIESILKEQEQSLADHYKEALELGQQVRLAREQMQRAHVELMETRRQQIQAQREADRLANELEEARHLSREKEAQANHLAEELGGAQAHGAQLEAKMQTEMKRLLADMESLKEASQLEMLTHQANHAKWKMSVESQKSSIQELSEQLEMVKRELEEAQGTVSNLQKQLQERNDLVQAANEALLVKESEVTRLQAQISGRERAGGIKHFSGPAVSPQFLQGNQEASFSNPSQAPFDKYPKLRRSISESDLSLQTGDDDELSEELLRDLKQALRHQPATLEDGQKETEYAQSGSLDESSFDPLTYEVDEDRASGSSDFSTLSGMLKYINKEMRMAENSLGQTSSAGENL